MLANKHLIVAMIVTPILAVIAYFAVDYVVSEKPHSAVAGNSYVLVPKSNCRYESGKCNLNNGDVKVSLESTIVNNETITLHLKSELPLEGIQVALTLPESAANPTAMQLENSQGTEWQTTLQHSNIKEARLQIALSVNNTLYFGETETTFTQYKTGFSQENISKQ